MRSHETAEALTLSPPPRTVKHPFEPSPRVQPSLFGSAGSDVFAALPSVSSPASARAAAARGGGGAALPLRPPPPVEQIFDPDWTEAAVGDGTVFWYRADQPSAPTFTRPLVQPLVAARSLYSSFARHALAGARSDPAAAALCLAQLGLGESGSSVLL